MSCGAGSREQPGAGSCWAPASCSLCFAVSGEKAGQEKRGLRAAGGWCLLRAWAGGSRLCWQPVWGSSGEPCALRGLSWEGAGVRGVGAERRGKEEGCGGMEGQSEVCRGAKPGPGAASGAGRAQIPCGAPSLPSARARPGNAPRRWGRPCPARASPAPRWGRVAALP